MLCTTPQSSRIWLVCNKGITQFLPATHTQTIPAFTPQPQGITTLWPVPTYTAWWTEAHRCEIHAQSFYTASPAETQTHDLLIASPTLYPHRHDATYVVTLELSPMLPLIVWWSVAFYASVIEQRVISCQLITEPVSAEDSSSDEEYTLAPLH